MSHLLSDHSFERDALDFFPTPLADTLDEAISEASTRAQRDKIVETFRVAIRLLGILALSGSATAPEKSSKAASFARKLVREGLGDGQWLGLVSEIVQPFAANPK